MEARKGSLGRAIRFVIGLWFQQTRSTVTKVSSQQKRIKIGTNIQTAVNEVSEQEDRSV